MIGEIARFQDELRGMVENTGRDLNLPEETATFQFAPDKDGLLKQAEGRARLMDYATDNADIRSLMHTVLYESERHRRLCGPCPGPGQEEPGGLRLLPRRPGGGLRRTASPGPGGLGGPGAQDGEMNLKVMGLLDAANTGAYGQPRPTPVPIGHKRARPWSRATT